MFLCGGSDSLEFNLSFVLPLTFHQEITLGSSAEKAEVIAEAYEIIGGGNQTPDHRNSQGSFTGANAIQSTS